jgi:hypothetical protein
MAVDELTLEQREGVDAPEFRDNPETAGEFLPLDDAFALAHDKAQNGGLSPEVAVEFVDELCELARQQGGLWLAQTGSAMGRSRDVWLAGLPDRLPPEKVGTLPLEVQQLRSALKQGLRPSIHGPLVPRITSAGSLPTGTSRVVSRPREHRATRRATARSPGSSEPDDPEPAGGRLTQSGGAR